MKRRNRHYSDVNGRVADVHVDTDWDSVGCRGDYEAFRVGLHPELFMPSLETL